MLAQMHAVRFRCEIRLTNTNTHRLLN